MPIARKIGLAILSPLFIFLLFATAFDIGFVRTATHPAVVKKLVADSGIYNSVIPNVLAQTKTISTSFGNVPTSDPDVQKAARVALSPQFIQQNTEMAIDNIYDWLDGKIAQPNFAIDLTGAKTLFANNIADSLQKRLNALPVCSATQSRQIAISGSFDAYNATCLPRGISPVTIAEQAKSQIINNQDFLANTSITANNINPPVPCANDSGPYSCAAGQNAPKSKFNYDNRIPAEYRLIKKTPLILSTLTILTGAGIIFLSSSWQRGLRHIGINLLIIGLVMLIFSWALNRTVSKNIVPKINVNSAIFQQDIRNLVTELSQQIDKNYWFFGGLYSGLGAGSVIATEVFHRRGQIQTATTGKAKAVGSDSPKR